MNPLQHKRPPADVAASDDRRLETSAEFTVGVRSIPFLAEHGFQDMVVLPGAFYIDLALRMEREHFHRVPRRIRNVAFLNPVILSEEDTIIRLEANKRDGGRVEYSFYEGGAGEDHGPIRARQLAARLEVETLPADARGDRGPEFSIETFQAQAQTVLGAEQFYAALRGNGNQYGPRFQNVSTIWRARDQVLGRLTVPGPTGPHILPPQLLDSITQLLASFILAKGQTFVLRAIEHIEITSFSFPDTLWGHAVLLPEKDAPRSLLRHELACSAGVAAGEFTGRLAPCFFGRRDAARTRRRDGCATGLKEARTLLGNIRVFDPSGTTYLELSGVALSLLEGVDSPDEKPAMNLVVAANFTAEPLEDSLNFWADHFGVPVRTEFAPYHQAFQQLLDAGSAFRRNTHGVNVVLLSLEEWAASSPHRMGRGRQGEGFAGTLLDEKKAARCFGNHPRYVLPNGLEIVHLNQYETEFLYKEIFEDECYLKHGIRLHDGDTVVDIGANIGLFSLFVMSRRKDPKIFAFEPAPVVFDLLKANCEVHGTNVRAVNAGVSDKAKTATFTFYEKSSVFSSFHADEAEDHDAIQTVVRNMLNGEAAGEPVEEYVNELTTDRLRCQTCECQLISVSDIIRENRIDTINLLKIDAEKSELDILNGIADADWPKISQIVMEIHDRTGEAVRRIEELLRAKGFHCAIEQEKLLEHSGLFNLYATRSNLSSGGRQPFVADARKDCRGVADLRHTVAEFCTALRSFAIQTTTPLILCICPPSPVAESDRELKAALDDAEQTLLAEAGTMPNVHTISSATLMRRHPVKDYYDPDGRDLGHIPYTPECYAAIGTALFRTVFNLKRGPFKVIALDCDDTLWKGVCGEDGPHGIEIGPPYRALQEFMIGQMNAGLLLCLCSRNNEQDVLDAFAQRTDMPLKREHLVSWRINWNSKSENLKALAHELNLGLDSFIFVDDNPVECAEVRINCPGVLTLQLPAKAESFASFLDHVWAFDHSGTTGEDRKRTRLYQESVKRQQFREQSLSLKDYIKGLRLRVEIAEAADDQLSRVSQLTFRTNQFNLTTLRRPEQEVRDFLNRPGANCLAVRVADRFGDYGLVGVVMYETCADRFKVDTFLLSCRALGRGVEHAVASHLGRRAVSEGKQFVELTCLPTEKNQPAREFIAGIGATFQNNGGTTWTVPAGYLAGVEYEPDQAATNGREENASEKAGPITPRREWRFEVADLSEQLQRIAGDWCDTHRLAKAIEEHRLRKEAGDESPAAASAPSNGNGEGGLQTALLNIWRNVLARPRISVNDNFFEAGGTSLRAVQVIARIKKELKRTLSIVTLFECPTVALLAARLSAANGETHENNPTAAAQRGRQRRYNTRRTSPKMGSAGN